MTTKAVQGLSRKLHFILKTIIDTALNIQGLRDSKLPHKPVLMKPKGKETQG